MHKSEGEGGGCWENKIRQEYNIVEFNIEVEEHYMTISCAWNVIWNADQLY